MTFTIDIMGSHFTHAEKVLLEKVGFKFSAFQRDGKTYYEIVSKPIERNLATLDDLVGLQQAVGYPILLKWGTEITIYNDFME